MVSGRVQEGFMEFSHIPLLDQGGEYYTLITWDKYLPSRVIPRVD